jgi:ADP-ribosyl-[dinitrogen reductase] hydrolase
MNLPLPSTPSPESATPLSSQERIAGLLLGGAVGDALGLPAEGLSRRRISALGWNRWRHRLLFGHGMVSDDTDHAWFTAQALLQSAGEPSRFGRRLAGKLRWWLAGLPAGVGLATGRAIFKLWLGFPPQHSGVCSAGNGPAMRSPVIGALYGPLCAQDPARMADLVRVSTRITHRDPRALVGAQAVALGAAFGMAGQGPPEMAALLKALCDLATEDGEWQQAMQRLQDHLASGAGVAEYAAALGQGEGVGGYIYHTVPVALYAWLRHYGDFPAALSAALDCGGDTDTLGAITGALAGVSCGEGGIPPGWVQGIVDWPRSPALLRRTAHALAVWCQGGKPAPVRLFAPAVLPRNLLFLAVVLLHGLLRLLPATFLRRLIP